MVCAVAASAVQLGLAPGDVPSWDVALSVCVFAFERCVAHGPCRQNKAALRISMARVTSIDFFWRLVPVVVLCAGLANGEPSCLEQFVTRLRVYFDV